MPPTRAAALSAASKRVRDSSSDSTLSSDDIKPDIKPVTKKKAVVKSKAVKEEDGDEPKTKKPRAAPKPKAYPPPDLEPSTFPPRKGHPAYAFAADAEVHNPSSDSINGSIAKPMHLGAHVSSAGGPAFALLNAGKLGANGLALFLKNQKRWTSKDYEEEDVNRFRKLMVSAELDGLDYASDYILPHGSYLINLGNPDAEKRKKSYECFVDDLKRCEQLGLKLYNWHPGSTVGACTHDEALVTIADSINEAHKEVGGGVVCVLENMANAKSNIVGSAFSHLAGIIDMVKDKTRVGVCLDTCHLFAAGYDIRTPEAYAKTMQEFDDVVGIKYLRGMHLNDSKADFAACKDLHENIGLGKIGLDAFRLVMRDSRLQHIPLVLETPGGKENREMEIYAAEIELLYEIQKIEDDQWLEKRVEIEQRWRGVRDGICPPVIKAPKGKKAKVAKDSPDSTSE